MVFGLSLSALTLRQVSISLAGIGSGFVVLAGLLSGRRLDGWTAVLTSLTGFLFPFEGLKPSYIVGGISLMVLAICALARYSFRMAGSWRRIYVITAAIGLYFNCFVAVVQSFLKIPVLHAIAPNGNEPSFFGRAVTAPGYLRLVDLPSGQRFRIPATAAV